MNLDKWGSKSSVVITAATSDHGSSASMICLRRLFGNDNRSAAAGKRREDRMVEDMADDGLKTALLIEISERRHRRSDLPTIGSQLFSGGR